jgi:hypothetical protein
MAETPASTYKINTFDTVPADKANVRILLVSGQKTDFLVLPSDTIEQFCQLVYDQWPAGISI